VHAELYKRGHELVLPSKIPHHFQMLLLLGIYTEKNIRLFSYAELRSATDNFNRTNKVGRGGFGTVYKVVFVSSIIYRKKNKCRYFLLNLNVLCSLSLRLLGNLVLLLLDGNKCLLIVLGNHEKRTREVAVKVLSAESRQGVREFLTEIDVIANVKHPDLVELVGCCVEENNRILVYEYLQNSSLDRALLGMTIPCV
jgi:serine/threonine protein kinase